MGSAIVISGTIGCFVLQSGQAVDGQGTGHGLRPHAGRDSGLSLQDIMALDKVQKHQALTADEEKALKAEALIEGRKPNFFVAKSLAQQTGPKASYSKNRAFDKQYYLDLICKAVKEHGSLARKDIDELLWNKLPDWMDDKQRKTKVGNLITELRRNHQIINRGTDARPSWALVTSQIQ
jgi:ATP-dependent DNA helicase RecG